MTDDINEEEKELEGPTPGVAAVEEEEVAHDEFDVLFPPEGDEAEDDEHTAGYKRRQDEEDEEEDYPFSGDQE